jgi:hypothetical protein
MGTERVLTVKLSYSETSKKFFIDFWNGDTYLVSEVIPENHALALSKHMNIKIMLN